MIGFQKPSYTFQEPESETDITGVVFLKKQYGRVSEQTFKVVIDVSTATPNANVHPATITSRLADGTIIDNDYLLLAPDQTRVVLSFHPDAQTLDFVFTLFPDNLPEDTEAFQAKCSSLVQAGVPMFSVPSVVESTDELFPATFIIINDNDSELCIHLYYVQVLLFCVNSPLEIHNTMVKRLQYVHRVGITSCKY